MALVGAGAVSVQFGAALASRLFGRVGPAGAVTLRLVSASAVLLLVAGVRRHTQRRNRAVGGGRPAGRTARRRHDMSVVVAFGLVLAGMNLSFYEAISRIPLGVAVTIEFSGPLTLALLSSRRLLDGLWALAAAAGVALLASGAGRRLDHAGVGLALVAGALWAAYILLSRETGRRYESVDGLTWAMTTGAAALLPLGALAGGTRLLHPGVLAQGALVGVMSSVIPYSLELLALRRVTARAFGVMMSLDPAVATAAGFSVLGQKLDAREWAALFMVVAANLGNVLTARRERTPVAVEP